MKNVMNGRQWVANLLSMITLVLLTTIVKAQDKGIDINVDLDKNDIWYSNPIIWIIGAAVFILLLVALLRGNSNKA